MHPEDIKDAIDGLNLFYEKVMNDDPKALELLFELFELPCFTNEYPG